MKTLILIASGLLVVACGSSAPSRELVDARAAYRQAALGNAASQTPAELHTARVALDRAEREADDEGNSRAARDLAYSTDASAQR